jgi:hypothetical protein
MDSTADLVFLSTNQLYVLAAVSLVGFFLTTVKVLFGSYSIPHILREYSKTKLIQETYSSMHSSRENFCYHIGAARERGDKVEAFRLAKELQALDAQIEEMEKKYLGKG